MQVKLKEVIEAEEELTHLQTVSLPIKVSYRLKRIMDKALPDVKAYYEKRLELFKEYGEHDAEKNAYSVKTENVPKVTEELEKLTDIDVNIDFEKIKIDDLEGTLIEPKYLISWIFE